MHTLLHTTLGRPARTRQFCPPFCPLPSAPAFAREIPGFRIRPCPPGCAQPLLFLVPHTIFSDLHFRRSPAPPTPLYRPSRSRSPHSALYHWATAHSLNWRCPSALLLFMPPYFYIGTDTGVEGTAIIPRWRSFGHLSYVAVRQPMKGVQLMRTINPPPVYSEPVPHADGPLPASLIRTLSRRQTPRVRPVPCLSPLPPLLSETAPKSATHGHANPPLGRRGDTHAK